MRPCRRSAVRRHSRDAAVAYDCTTVLSGLLMELQHYCRAGAERYPPEAPRPRVAQPCRIAVRQQHCRCIFWSMDRLRISPNESPRMGTRGAKWARTLVHANLSTAAQNVFCTPPWAARQRSRRPRVERSSRLWAVARQPRSIAACKTNAPAPPGNSDAGRGGSRPARAEPNETRAKLVDEWAAW